MRNTIKIGIVATALSAATALTGAALAGQLKTATDSEPIAGSGTAARAVCNGARKAISGGVQMSGDTDSSLTILKTLKRDRKRGWEANVERASGDDGGQLKVFAYCRKEEVFVGGDVETLPDGVPEAVVARCPQGTTPLSGGFAGPIFDSPYAYVSKRKGLRAWLVKYISFDPGLNGLAQANCYEGPPLEVRSRTRTLEPGSSFETFRFRLGCPAETDPISAGFSSSEPLSEGGPFVTTSKRVPGRDWLMKVRVSTVSLEFTAYVYCEEA